MAYLCKKLGLLVMLQFVGACSADSTQATSRPDGGVDVTTLPEADVAAQEAAPTIVCGMVEKSGDACQACIVQACCSEAEACEDEPACNAYRVCASDCETGAQDCLDGCIVNHASGYPVAQVLDACVAHECNEACERLPEEQCGGAIVDEACQPCAAQKCCDAYHAYLSNADVHERTACLVDCHPNDPDCLDACDGQHEEGFAKSYLLYSCLGIECTQACSAELGVDAPCGLYMRADSVCRTCEEEQCCEFAKQVSNSEDFWRLYACQVGCGGDSACIELCNLDHLEGYARAMQIRACDATNCFDECGGSATFSSQCGGLYMTNAVCDDCAQESCCDEFTDLMTSFEGSAFFACRGYCEEEGCVTNCATDYPDGYVLEGLMNTCVYETCGEENGCSPPFDWVCGSRIREEGVDCGACIETSCCDENLACARDFDCARIDLCRHMEGCLNTDAACLDSCKNANPDGADKFDAAFDCRMSACPVECAYF